MPGSSSRERGEGSRAYASLRLFAPSRPRREREGRYSFAVKIAHAPLAGPAGLERFVEKANSFSQNVLQRSVEPATQGDFDGFDASGQLRSARNCVLMYY